MSTPGDLPPGHEAAAGVPQQPTGGTPSGWGPPPQWQQPGQSPSAARGGSGPITSDDTTWALLAHLSFFVLGVVGPLIIYLVKKDTSPFVRQHAAEALNFHITITLAVFVSALLILVLIGVVLLLAVLVAGAVLAVLAAIAANRGESYRYPFTLRLVS
jgi:uncharacterized protein